MRIRSIQATVKMRGVIKNSFLVNIKMESQIEISYSEYKRHSRKKLKWSFLAAVLYDL